MRNLILSLLAVSAPAAAQPVTQPATCQVTVSRAPDEVRDAIEAWVAAEPRCTSTLDVRVVPTDGGFYLFARDEAGRVRERVVPDAQSAGVLVASWVADDLIARHAPETEGPPAPAIAPTPAPDRAPAFAPPSTTTPMPQVDAVVAPAKRNEPYGRWLMVALTIDKMLEHGGIRAELDIKRYGAWSFGVGLARSHADLPVMSSVSWDSIHTSDTRAIGTVSRTTTFGRRWQVRLALGAGMMHTDARGWVENEEVEASGVFPTADLSLLLGMRMFDNWALAFGAIATANAQTYKIGASSGLVTVHRDDLEHAWFTGLRRRL